MQQGKGLQVLNIIHKALMTAQIIFASVCFYLLYSKSVLPIGADLDRILQVAALIMAAVGIFAGMTIFKKKLIQIREMQTGVQKKFQKYRTACLIQWALLEGPSFFSIIFFFLTGNYAFLALVLVILFLFAITAPSKGKVLMQLQISEVELDDL